MAIKCDILSVERPDLQCPGNDSNEIVVAEIWPNPNYKFYAITCYKSQSDDRSKFIYNLDITLQQCIKTGCNNLILLGDFNYPDLKWGTAHENPSELSAKFLDVCRCYGLHQFNKNPSTDDGNILELILSNTSMNFSNIVAGYHPFRSDHYTVSFNTNITCTKLPSVKRTVYNFNKADYNAIKNDLNNCELLSGITAGGNVHEVDKMWQSFHHNLTTIINKHIPKVKVRNTHSPPWIDCEVLTACRKKLLAFRVAMKHRKPNTWKKFTKLRNHVKHLMKVKYNCFIMDLAGNLSDNPKKFWSFIQSRTKSRASPSVIIKEGHKYMESSVKANIFNNFFHSVFNKNPPSVSN